MVERTDELDLAFAHRLADEAATISFSHFHGELRSWSKADGSLATEADVAVENALRIRFVGTDWAMPCSVRSDGRPGPARDAGS